MTAPPEIAKFLQTHPAWTFEVDTLARTYRFADFIEAFGWMTSVALVAERDGHHPEWRNVWATVDVRLRTHDAGNNVTDKDIRLARTMERLAVPLLQSATTVPA